MYATRHKSTISLAIVNDEFNESTSFEYNASVQNV